MADSALAVAGIAVVAAAARDAAEEPDEGIGAPRVGAPTAPMGRPPL